MIVIYFCFKNKIMPQHEIIPQKSSSTAKFIAKDTCPLSKKGITSETRVRVEGYAKIIKVMQFPASRDPQLSLVFHPFTSCKTHSNSKMKGSLLLAIVAVMAAGSSFANTCGAQYQLDECRNQRAAKLEQCGPSDWKCQCDVQTQIAACYTSFCPNDPYRAQDEGMVITYCTAQQQIDTAHKQESVARKEHSPNAKKDAKDATKPADKENPEQLKKSSIPPNAKDKPSNNMSASSDASTILPGLISIALTFAGLFAPRTY